MKQLTVQQLIDELLKVEDKSAIIVKYNLSYGVYQSISRIYNTTIPETLESFDEDNTDINHINCVII